jgi:hypothetical protein
MTCLLGYGSELWETFSLQLNPRCKDGRSFFHIDSDDNHYVYGRDIEQRAIIDPMVANDAMPGMGSGAMRTHVDQSTRHTAANAWWL